MASCSCSPGPLSLSLTIISAHVVMQTATRRGCFHSELVPFLPDGGDQMLPGEGERTQGSVSHRGPRVGSSVRVLLQMSLEQGDAAL